MALHVAAAMSRCRSSSAHPSVRARDTAASTASHSRACSPTRRGLYVVYPSNPADAKGLLKTAIRTNNPVLYVESQNLYPMKGTLPDGDVVVRVREGGDRPRGLGCDARDVRTGGPRLCRRGGAAFSAEHGTSTEVIDLRSLVPLDMDTVLASVRKTGRAVGLAPGRAPTAVSSTTSSRRSSSRPSTTSMRPVGRIGALAGISPQATSLEQAFLPSVDDIVAAVVAIG